MTTADETTLTSASRPSSPRRKGSVKGLAYLASRRGSRDSVVSNASNVSNEDIGPLNFQNTARGRQRRTSNFLELPGESVQIFVDRRWKVNPSKGTCCALPLDEASPPTLCFFFEWRSSSFVRRLDRLPDEFVLLFRRTGFV